MKHHQEGNETTSFKNEPQMLSENKLFSSLPKRKYVEKDDKIVLGEDDELSANLNPDECFDQDSNTYFCPLCDFKAQSAPSLARHHGAVHRGIR